MRRCPSLTRRRHQGEVLRAWGKLGYRAAVRLHETPR